MKYIKKFENNSNIGKIGLYPSLITKVCKLYEDIKSIGYLLEDEGITVEYRLRLVRLGRGSLLKEVGSVRIGSSEDIKDILTKDPDLREIYVHIKNPGRIFQSEESPSSKEERAAQEVWFRGEFDRYFTMLKEHLDYVDRRFFEIRSFRPPLSYDILLSSDFFRQ